MSNITPPPELVQQWASEWLRLQDVNRDNFMATRAAQWGADQELEACCEWLQHTYPDGTQVAALWSARRPKPPRLKQQALDLLKTDLEPGQEVASITLPAKSIDTIRRALESLPDE